MSRTFKDMYREQPGQTWRTRTASSDPCMEQGEQAHIIAFRQRYVERSNGVKIDLGPMTLFELQLLEEQCNERFKDAHHELVVVRDVLEQPFPYGQEVSG